MTDCCSQLVDMLILGFKVSIQSYQGGISLLQKNQYFNLIKSENYILKFVYLMNSDVDCCGCLWRPLTMSKNYLTFRYILDVILDLALSRSY